MSKQQEVRHDHCKCKAGIVAPGVVVESTVVPIVKHVTPILVPKPNVVVESTVVPTVEHETNILLPKSNVVVDIKSPFTAIASKNRKANRKVATKTKFHLDEADSSLDTKENKFDQFDKLERFRLLVDLVNDSSNRIYIEVMNRLEEYKERYSRLRKARRKKKD
ncbi:hypothetical protein LOK49_Contig10G00004 [Camellia lanceoleosa]|nr:hypothetical protein LOK49_Contig10G00004 [Camellia lanceoleosa]